MHAQVEPNESRSGRTILDLLRSLTLEMRDLVRDEVQLAKAEVRTSVSRASSGAIALGAGALVAFAGFLVFLDAIVLLVSKLFEIESLWLAPLIVGVVVMAIGYTLLKSAQKRLDLRNLAPRRAARSMRADAMMFKEKVS